MRTVFASIVLAALMVGLVACGAKPCKDLEKKACEAAAGSPACEAAGRMSNGDECAGYLKDVARYVELKNLVVTTPGVKPPAPVVVPVAEPAAVPAPAPVVE